MTKHQTQQQQQQIIIIIIIIIIDSSVFSQVYQASYLQGDLFGAYLQLNSPEISVMDVCI